MSGDYTMPDKIAPPLTIDLKQFKLHLKVKERIETTLHFDSPSRMFYLSVIAFLVHQMQKTGKVASIPLAEHLRMLALLNETVGGAAGSSEKESLLPRIYRKWKDALPNLEGAPLFKALGRKRQYDEASRKIYLFTEKEKDLWANLFEYKGSEENVRLKFAIDKIGLGLDDVTIVYGEETNEAAWSAFLSGLNVDDASPRETENNQPSRETSGDPMQPVTVQTFRRRLTLRQAGIAAAVIAIAGVLVLFSWSRLQKPTLSFSDKPSIAVLPFVNINNDAKQESLCDGLTEEIITTLSRSPDLLVIARTSTYAYKGKQIRVDQVAGELGVRYVLEGSVRGSGKDVRITAQLIDATTGSHVWADRYDDTAGDIFALEDRITERIVAAITVNLTPGKKEITIHKETENVFAHAAFLQGWDHYLKHTSENFAEAVRLFKKAIELDPGYGRAYAALALTYWSASYGSMGKKLGIAYADARLLAREYHKEAMKNPTALAHLLSSQYYLSRRQHDEAIAELKQALALEPNNPSCHALMGRTLFFSNRPQEAIEFINQAIRLDPRNKNRYLPFLGGAQFCMGNTQEAAALVEQGIKLHPELTGTAGWLIASYGLLGRAKDAHAAIETFNHWKIINHTLKHNMYFYPFKDRAVADRFAEGLIKAGMRGAQSGYLPAFKENRLSGDEIRKLLFGTTTTGPFGVDDNQQWWIHRNKNGDFTWRGPETEQMDSGTSRIEGDMLCQQFRKRWGGNEFCSTVFRNPKGKAATKDEYFLAHDMGFVPFSVAP